MFYMFAVTHDRALCLSAELRNNETKQKLKGNKAKGWRGGVCELSKAIKLLCKIVSLLLKHFVYVCCVERVVYVLISVCVCVHLYGQV